MTLRYIPVIGTAGQPTLRDMRETILHEMGECMLVWVNEEDFMKLDTTNVSAEANERREYERLRKKYEWKE